MRADDRGWVDDLTREQLLSLLREHGTDVGVPGPAHEGEGKGEGEVGAGEYDIVPLRDGWLRVGPDERGVLVGRWIDDPGRPEEVLDTAGIVLDDLAADDLDDWMRARAVLGASGRRWVSVFRRPEREAYIALAYEAGGDAPVRQRIISGLYPDITLFDDDPALVAFVEPDRVERERTRAVLTPVGDGFTTARRVLLESTSGGLGLQACSVRRFLKLSHGVRTVRVWDLVDVRTARPAPITVPGVPDDPNLFDVALLDGEVVLAQAVNTAASATVGLGTVGVGAVSLDGSDHWELVVSVIEDDEVRHGWRAATGPGRILEVVSGDGCALVRVQSADTDLVRVEHVLRVPLAGFSTKGVVALHSTTGLFSLQVNTVTPSVGFGAVELNGGSEPYAWYWDPEGRVLNSAAEIAERGASRTNQRFEKLVSDDGYEFFLDLRWRADQGEHFTGPVLLMVYGAYGMDVDLDTDRDLGRWLDRGFAVGTPHVRGGGRGARHLAGCRANRDRSLADVRVAVRWLRAGQGAVTAELLCVLGASAGGFLAATTLNTCGEDVDACVIVNGFVDPLTSLLRQDTATTASDQDEWGDPAANVNDLETLLAISPVDNLTTAGRAKALVIVSAKDVRVNPRQGLKWYLTYRALGGEASLWFDPNGAHDCWGGEMDPDALVDWVCDALDLRGCALPPTFPHRSRADALAGPAAVTGRRPSPARPT